MKTSDHRSFLMQAHDLDGDALTYGVSGTDADKVT